MQWLAEIYRNWSQCIPFAAKRATAVYLSRGVDLAIILVVFAVALVIVLVVIASVLYLR